MPPFRARTHENVRTLKCLAQNCPWLPVWNTQIRRTTVDGGRASLASPVHEDQTYWKLELAPFRCSAPHSPSLDSGLKLIRKEGVAGAIARILRRSVPAHARFMCTNPAELLPVLLLLLQCIAKVQRLRSTKVHRINPDCDEFPIHAEPTKHIKFRTGAQLRQEKNTENNWDSPHTEGHRPPSSTLAPSPHSSLPPMIF
jgi:hypothetical protein